MMCTSHCVLHRVQESVLVRLRWWAAIGLLVAGLGGVGLWLIMTRVWPDPAMELAFLDLLGITDETLKHSLQGNMLELVFLGLLAITFGGLTIPVAAYLNYRFGQPDWQTQDPRRLLRQGAWVSLLSALFGWLQKERVLNWTIAAVIIGVFALMEAFFLTRDHA